MILNPCCFRQRKKADLKARICRCSKLAWGAALSSSFFCSWPMLVMAQDATQSSEEFPSDADAPSAMLVLDTIYTSAQDTSVAPQTWIDKTRHIEIGEVAATGSLADIFQGESLLRVQDSGGRLQRQTISMRGSASQDVLLTYHGIPLNALSWASADLSLIPAKLLSHAYIKPSVGSERAGSGALGGIIELESEFSPHDLEVATAAGSLADFAIFGRKTFTLSDFVADIALFADRTSGYYDYYDAQGSHQERTHNGAWRYGGQTHFLWDVHDLSLDAFVYAALFEREVAGFSEFPSAFAQALDAGALVLASVQADHVPVHLGKSDVSWTLSASHRFSSDLYENPASYLGGRKTRDHYFENDTKVSFLAAFHYAQSFATTLELAYGYQRVDDEHLVMLTSVSSSHDRHIFSMRAEETASFLEDSLQVFAGMRIDYILQKEAAYSPRLVFHYKPWSWFSMHASVAYAMRFPAFDELYIHTESVRGDEDISKQTSWLSDLTLKFDIMQKASIEISGFYHLHEDLIRFLPVTAYLYQAKNLPSSVARGIDIQARWSPWEVLQLSLGYAWNDSFVREGHLPIPGIAEHRLTGRAEFMLSNFDLWLQASYSAHIAQKLSGQFARKNPFRLDAHASLMISNQFRVTLDFNNLTNDKRSEDFRQYPLPGIHVMAGLDIILD